jgi:hypothetical protein
MHLGRELQAGLMAAPGMAAPRCVLHACCRYQRLLMVPIKLPRSLSSPQQGPMLPWRHVPAPMMNNNHRWAVTRAESTPKARQSCHIAYNYDRSLRTACWLGPRGPFFRLPNEAYFRKRTRYGSVPCYERVRCLQAHNIITVEMSVFNKFQIFGGREAPHPRLDALLLMYLYLGEFPTDLLSIGVLSPTVVRATMPSMSTMLTQRTPFLFSPQHSGRINRRSVIKCQGAPQGEGGPTRAAPTQAGPRRQFTPPADFNPNVKVQSPNASQMRLPWLEVWRPLPLHLLISVARAGLQPSRQYAAEPLVYCVALLRWRRWTKWVRMCGMALGWCSWMPWTRRSPPTCSECCRPAVYLRSLCIWLRAQLSAAAQPSSSIRRLGSTCCCPTLYTAWSHSE